MRHNRDPLRVCGIGIIVVASILVGTESCNAQPPDDTTGNFPEAREQVGLGGDQIDLTVSENELSIRFVGLVLGLAILIFALAVMWTIVYVSLKRKRFDELLFKALGLTLLVSSGLFLIVAGYSDEQLAPMMGLLGTLAGYILGREGKSGQEQDVESSGESESADVESPGERVSEGAND